MQLPAEILIAAELSADDATQLVDDLEAVGLAADLREVAPRRSLEGLAWLALIAVPLQPFFNKLLENFAADAYVRLSALAARILGATRRRQQPTEPRVLLLQDPGTGVRIALEPDLPPKAFEQLLVVDLATIRRGPLQYDRYHGRWRSVSDEAAADRPAPAD